MDIKQKIKPDDLYKSYNGAIGQPELNELVKSLEPTINYTLSSLNAGNDKVLKAQARVIAAESIMKYDPSSGSSLPTYVTNNLKQLHRMRRQLNSPIKMSDRLQYDNYAIQKAEKEFTEQFGRDPDMLELADYSGVSIKKIKKIKDRFTMASVNESSFGGNDVGSYDIDYTNEAIDYVYHELEHKDRKILDHTVGYGGAKLLQDKELSEKLGISLSQLSRRRAAVALKIHEMERMLDEQY